MAPGPGGRISLSVVAGAALTLQVSAGTDADPSDGNSAGAGTVFMGEGNGELVVDNRGQGSINAGTTARSVGRHVIERAESTGTNQWRLSRRTLPFTRYTGTAVNQTDVVFRSLELSAPTTLSFELYSYDWEQQIRVFKLASATTLGERINPGSYDYDLEARTQAQFNLPAGQYAVTVVWSAVLDSEIETAFNGTFTPQGSPNYELSEEESLQRPSHELYIREQSPWRNLSGQLKGLQVDLNLDDDTSPLYTIINNSSSSITVESETDLSDTVGKQFVGVKLFDALSVHGGAYLDLGEDKVIISDPTRLSIDTGSTLSTGGFDAATEQALVNNPAAGTVNER